MKLPSCRSARPAIAAMVIALSGIAMAQQTNPNAIVTGTLQETGPFGYDETTTFSCRGLPTCSGTYSTTVRLENCTNYMTFGGSFVITGFNLAQSGPISGTVTLSPGFNDNPTRLPGGTCTPGPDAPTESVPYSGTWNAATGTGTANVLYQDPSGVTNVPFTFKADVSAPPPVFEMVVRATIGPQTATASADIQFRPQDVGQNSRVFTFASAPSTRVQGGLLAKAVHLGSARVDAKADPVSCVLAQLSPSGQLVAVSAAQLQAFSTGVLSASGTSVSILNNTPTPNVAGATFYVGYGASGQAMLDAGIFRNAVLVPGTSTCPPLPYMTSLWWNPGESGWGLNLNQQGSTMFGTLFTYDASRAPMWLVMSGGVLQSDGVTFTGDLYRTTGPAFNANPFTPIGAANVTRVGTMSVSFSQANAGTLTYAVNGVTVQKSIQRQVYGSRSANCLPATGARTASTQYQDLWWNANESGWGINVTHQDNTLFATLFTYDASGRDLWLVMSAGARQADGSYLGDLYRTSGSPFSTQPFPPIAGSDVATVGNMRLRFTNGDSGTLTYTYNGATVTKQIARQVFSTPMSACN